MAFNPSNNRAQSSVANTQDDSWKAQAFINFSLPDASGRMVKVGALPLKASVEVHAWIMDVLEKSDPNVDTLSKILDKMVISFNSATPAKTAGFSLD